MNSYNLNTFTSAPPNPEERVDYDPPLVPDHLWWYLAMALCIAVREELGR